MSIVTECVIMCLLQKEQFFFFIKMNNFDSIHECAEGWLALMLIRSPLHALWLLCLYCGDGKGPASEWMERRLLTRTSFCRNLGKYHTPIKMLFLIVIHTSSMYGPTRAWNECIVILLISTHYSIIYLEMFRYISNKHHPLNRRLWLLARSQWIAYSG